MRSAQQPRIARWLLSHFGCGPNNDAVIGDLDERYSGGRTVAWYWRQMLVAIIAGVFTEVRVHKLHAIRVLILGWLLLFPGFWLQTPGLWRLYFMSPRFWYPLIFIVNGPYPLLWWAGVGWLIARLHRPAMVLFLALSVVPAFSLKVVMIITYGPGFSLPQYLIVFGGALLPLASLLVGGGAFRSRRQDQPRITGA